MYIVQYNMYWSLFPYFPLLTDIGVLLIILFPELVKRKTLVLDLDETLIHSHHDG